MCFGGSGGKWGGSPSKVCGISAGLGLDSSSESSISGGGLAVEDGINVDGLGLAMAVRKRKGKKGGKGHRHMGISFFLKLGQAEQAACLHRFRFFEVVILRISVGETL